MSALALFCTFLAFSFADVDVTLLITAGDGMPAAQIAQKICDSHNSWRLSHPFGFARNFHCVSGF
jgi:hypothetical protein